MMTKTRNSRHSRPAGRRINKQTTKRAHVSREDRVATRQKLGPLRNLIASKRTHTRYEKAVTRFFWHSDINGDGEFSTCLALDGAVAHYIEVLWEEGEPRYLAEDTICGLQKFVPMTKGHFQESWMLVSAWQRHELPTRATPMSMLILQAFLGAAIQLQFFDLAHAVALGYHNILRTSEMLQTQYLHLEFNSSLTSGVQHLPNTKSGNRNNILESVLMDDSQLIRFLHKLKLQQQPGDFIYASSSKQFRSEFQQTIRALRVPQQAYFQPYSIRRGAATEHFRMQGSLSKTCVRGRWANERTCRIYISESSLALSEFSASWHITQLQSHFASIAHSYFS